jgi:hypothetical protein
VVAQPSIEMERMKYSLDDLGERFFNHLKVEDSFETRLSDDQSLNDFTRLTLGFFVGSGQFLQRYGIVRIAGERSVGCAFNQ